MTFKKIIRAINAILLVCFKAILYIVGLLYIVGQRGWSTSRGPAPLAAVVMTTKKLHVEFVAIW